MFLRRVCLIVLSVATLLLLITGSTKSVFADQGFDSSPPTCGSFGFAGTPIPGNTITVSVTCQDNVGGTGIASTTLAINGQTVSTASSSNLSYAWIPASAGTYTITAIATDNAGNKSSPSSTQFTINNSSPLQPNVTLLKSCTNTTITDPNQFLRITWSPTNPPVSYVIFGLWNWYFYNKYVSGLTSTTAPNGFYGYYNTSSALPLYPGVWYSVQLWNGNWGATNWVYIPPCPPPSQPNITYDTNTSCITAPYTGSGVTFSWVNTNAPVTWVDIIDKTNPNKWLYYHKQVTTTANQPASTTGPNGFLGFSPNNISGQQISMLPGTTYYARLWDGSNFSPEAQISIPLCPSCTTGSTNCGAWSPNTDYTCSLTQTRTCSRNTDPGGTCTTTSYTDTQTINTTCTSHPNYSCVTGTCAIPTPSPPGGSDSGGSGSPTGSCPAPGTSATLSWGNSAGATSYNVRVTSTTKSASGSPYNFSPLTPGWIYGDPGIPSNSWGVRAINAGGTSSETAGAPFLCVPSSSTPNTPDPNNPNSPNGGFYACSGNTYTGNLTWGGSPYYTDPDGAGLKPYQWGFWVNISVSDPNFSAYYQKWIPCDNLQNKNTCRNITPIPGVPGDRFTYFNNNNTLDTLDSQTVYYYRVYNGNTSNPLNIPFSKTCPPSTPNQANLSATCPAPGTTANVYWSRVSSSSYYLARVGSNTTDTRVSNPSDPTIPNTTVSTTTNTIYSSWGIKACNTGGCSTEAPGSPSIECKPYPAFLKTTGGDVHSNR
ncbi:MAG: hypothetical protein U1D67_03725 [Dehalococcoidia bacterium]|nr:hypothetical protein [Dehalococcoidia bacterium]